MDDSKTLKRIENKLSALIALTALSVFSSLEEKKDIKTEVVLSRSGIETTEIAKILGKNLAAVQKAIQRSMK